MSSPIDKLSTKEFAKVFRELHSKILEDPLKYFVRGPGFCNFKPTPAQTVAFKCIFAQPLDSVTQFEINIEDVVEFAPVEGSLQPQQEVFNLVKTQMTEYELYKYMTGVEYNADLSVAKNRINLIVGRRGGKSIIASILSLFYAVKMNWKPFLKKTPFATVLILSHTRELSQEILETIRQLVQESPVLSRLLDIEKANTQSTFNLKVPFIVKEGDNERIEYSPVQIKVGAASKKTTRGIAACAVLCDEVAFWGTEENAAARDVDILQAVRPAMAQFGDNSLLIKLSSPGIKQGIFYDEYIKRDELPDSYIVFKAPSWVWNTLISEKYFRDEYKLDPHGFACEYRADFVDSISDFISPEMTDLCVLKGVTINTPEAVKSDVVYAASIDAAFKSDKFTFTITGSIGGRIKQYVMKTWQGSKAKPLQTRDVVQFIYRVCKQYGVNEIHADQYAFQPLREFFMAYDLILTELTFTNTVKKNIYFNLKHLIHNQMIDLLDHLVMVNEIKQLQVEQTDTGTIRIGHPPGGHDDCADATAIACWVLVSQLSGSNVSNFQVSSADPYSSLIPRDLRTGKAFVAPSASMLGDLYGYDITDNSQLYERDPNTGLMVRKEEDDDEGPEDDGMNFIMG